MGKTSLIISSGTRTYEQLSRLRELPLEQKINLTLRRIEQFYTQMDGKTYIAFSGGKDSTVLVSLVRSLYPYVQAVFCNTGVEYPGILDFVKTFDNVLELKPKMSFWKVIEKYGLPVVSKENSQKIYEIKTTKSEKLKNKRLYGDEQGRGKLPEKWKYLLDEDIKISHNCCNVLKKNPVKHFEHTTGLSPFIGTMAVESNLRLQSWLKTGCNAFDSKRPTSTPLAFWREEDIWAYIKKFDISIAKTYDTEARTGCMYCLFGCQYNSDEGANKFDRMLVNYPKHYRVAEKKGIIRALNLIRPKKEMEV